MEIMEIAVYLKDIIEKLVNKYKRKKINKQNIAHGEAKQIRP